MAVDQRPSGALSLYFTLRFQEVPGQSSTQPLAIARFMFATNVLAGGKKGLN